MIRLIIRNLRKTFIGNHKAQEFKQYMKRNYVKFNEITKIKSQIFNDVECALCCQ